MVRIFVIALICVGLTGCLDPQEEQPARTACGAGDLQHLIGTPVAAQDFSKTAAAVRILPPGAMMTMDHRPDRLNLEHDAGGEITRIWCG